MAVSRVLDRVGQVLGGRYRLLAPIGTGASASVYLADDAVLRRRVAVKVLHAALADDEAFLRRFRAEAQAAAALNHPHVVAVYDWGQDTASDRDGIAGIPYLVTEYLGGGSLRAMLDNGERLSASQALLVGLETARGLEYAHRRGFVHRDIKPANLLFDEDARLRIADFGLARALAEAAWTEPMGAVLGTARYASPEQARGESLDGKSDVYSLALVMIEAVTGRVPFSADTTIGTLMARVNQPLVVPDELEGLGDALRWAGEPDPARRPDASEFGAALMAAASRFDRPAPLALAGTRVRDGDLTIGIDPTETIHPEDERGVDAVGAGTADGRGAAAELADTASLLAAGAVPDDAALPSAVAVVGAPLADDVVHLPADPPRRGFFRGLPMTAPMVLPGEHEVGDDEMGDEAGAPFVAPRGIDVGADAPPFARWGQGAVHDPDLAAATNRHPAIAPATGVITASTATLDDGWGDDGWGDAGWDDDGTLDAGDGVPLTRKQARQARKDVRRHAVRYDRHGRPRPRRRRWPVVLVALVLATALGAGGGYAYWYYEVRVPLYKVPVLVGRNIAEVDPLVSPNHWTVDRHDRFDDAVPAGQVLDQDPAVGVEVPRGGTISVTVSSGRPPVAVPTNLVGLTLADATAALGKVGLGVGKVDRQFDENVAADVVLALAPNTPAQVIKGGDVGLVVSAGPKPRVIPDGLVGKPSTDAIAALKALGLVPSVAEDFSDSIVAGNVISIDPGVGKEAPKGSTVKLLVSKGPPLVEVPDVSGQSVDDATTALEKAGFVVSDVKGNPKRKIDHTDPAAGTKVKPGSKITLFTAAPADQ